ncbi:MAG: CRISPR-associated endonuclease Cas1 [Gemmataceae bacterium]
MHLVVNTHGAVIRRTGERFVISVEDRKIHVSAHKVQSLVITTGVLISSGALQLASEHSVDVILLDRFGDPVGRFWQTHIGHTARIRRRQLEVSQDAEGLAIVLEWAQAKVRHQIEFLEELWQRRAEADALFAEPVHTLRSCLAAVGQLTGDLAGQRGTLMGLEGVAGRAYFGCLGRLMPDPFRFEGRSRQPARDPFNAMLNYAYGVLYSLVEKACLRAGLDPCIGFLHTDQYHRVSLVYDMVEPFRIIADRTTVLLFTGRRVRQEYFDRVKGGYALNKEGRALLLSHLHARLDKTVRYPVQGQPHKTRRIKQRDVIQYEAYALSNRLLGRQDTPRIGSTEHLWSESAANGDRTGSPDADTPASGQDPPSA